jgi:hypothetical protein
MPSRGEAPLRERRDVVAEGTRSARAHRQRPRQQVEEGRLAGAVRADQADDLAGADLEADVVDRDQPPKRLTAPLTARSVAPPPAAVRRGSGSAPAKLAASTSAAAKRRASPCARSPSGRRAHAAGAG